MHPTGAMRIAAPLVSAFLVFSVGSCSARTASSTASEDGPKNL